MMNQEFSKKILFGEEGAFARSRSDTGALKKLYAKTIALYQLATINVVWTLMISTHVVGHMVEWQPYVKL